MSGFSAHPTEFSSSNSGPADDADLGILQYNDTPAQLAIPMETDSHMSDSSRKRCASGMGDERAGKVLKREPQDDILLSAMPPSTESLPLEAPTVFMSNNNMPPTMNVSLPPTTMDPRVNLHSAPPSRPPSPNSFISSFNHTQAPTTTPMNVNYSPFVPSSLPPNDFSPTLVNATVGPTPFPPLVRAWSEVSPPRHQHSLSAGSMNASQNLAISGSPSAPYALPPAFPPPLSALPRPTTSASSEPVGRLSRSGSISSGTSYVTPYPFRYPERPDPGTTSWPDNRARQPIVTPTNWYANSVPSGSTSSLSSLLEPGSKTPPTDDEGENEDEEEDDSDSSVPQGPRRLVCSLCLINLFSHVDGR